MKLLIPILILFFSFCNFKKDKVSKNTESEKKEADILLLKLNWFEGEVVITRNDTKLIFQKDLELEKEDIVETGVNGSVELLLGLDHYIKIGGSSKISLANLLTTNARTVTSLTLKEGTVLFIANSESKEEFTIVTPNALANTNGSVVLVRMEGNKNKPKDTLCDKSSCSTKFVNFSGNVHIKQSGSDSDLVLERKSEIHLDKEAERAPNNILPLSKNSIAHFRTLATFHSEEPVLRPELLEELNGMQEPIAKLKPVATLFPKKKSIILQKVPTKKLSVLRKATPIKTPVGKNIYKDKLKLESNKKF